MYIDDIKLFTENEKEIGNPNRLHRDDIGKEFDIEKWAMLIIRSRKQQMKKRISK